MSAEQNIVTDNGEIALLNAQIDYLKKQIAERDANRQAAMNVQPKTRVGWASYIIDNDRGLLDKYADAERAWQTARAQNEHARELADINNKNALALARMQKADQDAYNRDEWQLNLQKAQNELTAAKTAYAIAKKNGNLSEINTAQQALDNAKASVDYWAKRMGNVSRVEQTEHVQLSAQAPEHAQLSAQEPEQSTRSEASIIARAEPEHSTRNKESIIAEAEAELKNNLTKAEIEEQKKALEQYINQEGPAQKLYADYKRKKSKEAKDFDAAVKKAAIASAGGKDVWDAIGEDAQSRLLTAARAKLSKKKK